MTTGIVVIGALALVAPATAQQEPPSITRTVIAEAKLRNVVQTPLYFRILDVRIPARGTALSSAAGALYQISGSTEVSVGGSTKTLRAGEGQFVPGGQPASLRAGNDEASTLLQFVLAPPQDRDQPVAGAPATVSELYRTEAPIPRLRLGPYEINLTLVTLPARSPLDPPHYRSGAALYYVVSGTGTSIIDGTTETRGPGSLIYAPYGLVYQLGNSGDEPLKLLIFNLNPDNAADVLQGSPLENTK